MKTQVRHFPLRQRNLQHQDLPFLSLRGPRGPCCLPPGHEGLRPLAVPMVSLGGPCSGGRSLGLLIWLLPPQGG